MKSLLPESHAQISCIPVVNSSLFPFELMYEACCVETKTEVKIPSGEWVHGVILPEPSYNDFNHIELIPPTFNFFDVSERGYSLLNHFKLMNK